MGRKRGGGKRIELIRGEGCFQTQVAGRRRGWGFVTLTLAGTAQLSLGWASHPKYHGGAMSDLTAIARYPFSTTQRHLTTSFLLISSHHARRVQQGTLRSWLRLGGKGLGCLRNTNKIPLLPSPLSQQDLRSNHCHVRAVTKFAYVRTYQLHERNFPRRCDLHCWGIRPSRQLGDTQRQRILEKDRSTLRELQ